jgi:hypothetical protein
MWHRLDSVFLAELGRAAFALKRLAAFLTLILTVALAR